MPSPTGHFTLGPDDATLLIKTGRTGAMAKMGHDLDIRVNRWSAELELDGNGTASSLTLQADSTSLEVLGATGDPGALKDSDKAKIAKGVNDHVFKGQPITFASREVRDDGSGTLTVSGDLTLVGTTGPVSFTVTVAEDGTLGGRATVVQTAFGITPYSAMMGALKVEDEVGLVVEGRLPGA
jgi:polyisoprenoid-binding protein YceI